MTVSRVRTFVATAVLAAVATMGYSAELVPVTEAEKALVAAALPGPHAITPPKQTRRILIFSMTEGYVHACIPVADHALTELGRVTGAYEAVLSKDMEVFNDDFLSEFDAILLNNATRLGFDDPADRAALVAFVEGGKGLIGVHAAADSFYTWEEGSALLGGQFDGHPWTSDGTWAVKLDEPLHPANVAFRQSGFWIRDEIYQIGGSFSRDTHRVVLSLDMEQPANLEVEGIKREDMDFPISWIRKAGDGRVFYCNLGHNKHIYWTPEVLRHYLAGIQYALGDRDFPDAPSSTLSPPPQVAHAPTNPPDPTPTP